MRRVAFLSLITIGCAAALSATAAPQHKHSLKQPLFSNIDATGKLNIAIVPVSSSTHEYYSINDTKDVNARVRHHTLYLHQSGGKPAQVTIHMNTLNQVNLYGDSSLTANHIRSHGLSLHTNTRGNVVLNGMITVKELAVSGPSHVTMKWVNGDNIALYGANHAHINLAGNVGTVRAKLAGHSFLNAKNLRAHHTWIITRNFAQAEVLSTESIQAYPQGNSNIYYYKTPQLLNSTNVAAGNTLQLGWKS